jgi:hypothetical protein
MPRIIFAAVVLGGASNLRGEQNFFELRRSSRTLQKMVRFRHAAPCREQMQLRRELLGSCFWREFLKATFKTVAAGGQKEVDIDIEWKDQGN